MKKINNLFIIFLMIFTMTSCNDLETKNDTAVDTSKIIESTTEESDDSFSLSISTPSYDTPIRKSKSDFVYDDIFNLGNTISINVSISEEELNKLQSDYETGYKSEIYRLADNVVIIINNNGVDYTWEYDNVGIRQKGNTSRNDILYGKDINTYNHYKLSFDETFDNTEMYDSEFIKACKAKMNGNDYSDRDFLGLSGIDIKWNKNSDMTHIKEIYASKFYKACGIMTQNIGLTNYSMNITGKSTAYDFGLCTLYEPATKSLVKRALQGDVSYINMASWKKEKNGEYGIADTNYGDLYKCSYGCGHNTAWGGADLSLDSINGNGIGVGNISGSYIPIYERKTNTDTLYGDPQLKRTIRTINNGNVEDIEKLVDLKYLIALEAVGYFIGNPDDMRYDYNNYLIYIRRTDGKMIFIPYDTDRCFGITTDWNVMNGMLFADVLSDLDCSGNHNRNALLNKTIFTIGKYQDMYISLCKQIAECDWVKSESFYKYYDMAAKSYPNRYFSKNDNNYSFQAYMNVKVNNIFNLE